VTWRRALQALAKKMPGAGRGAIGGLLPALGAALLIGGCATPEAPSTPTLRPAEARARHVRALAAGPPAAPGWGTAQKAPGNGPGGGPAR